jgi:hypothetical protein
MTAASGWRIVGPRSCWTQCISDTADAPGDVQTDVDCRPDMSVGLGAVLWTTASCLLLGALGTPLRLEGFTFRPPEGFRMVRMKPFDSTKVGTVGAAPGQESGLLAALVDSDDSEASTLWLARVEGDFSVSPSSRDDFATAAVRHFAEELGLTLMMERVDRVEGPGSTARIEVLASVRQEGQIRQVLVAGFEGQVRHAVILFSAPPGRFQEKFEDFRASLDSFRNDPPKTATVPRGVAGAVAGAMAGGLLVSWALWRRLRLFRRA